MIVEELFRVINPDMKLNIEIACYDEEIVYYLKWQGVAQDIPDRIMKKHISELDVLFDDYHGEYEHALYLLVK